MNINNLYPTPIGSFSIENSGDMNKGLTDFIRSLRGEDSPSRSMIGGYHTNEDLLTRDNLYIKQFHEIISEQIIKYCSTIGITYIGPNTRLASWGMIYGCGNHAVSHTHAGADISSAYYCKVPTNLSKGEGEFVHSDPRPAARWDRNFQATATQEIPCQEGTGIIFPGWLEHYVTPHTSNEDRICITTNVFIDHGTFFR